MPVRVCLEINDLAFPIRLTQIRKDSFTVAYGSDVRTGLTYEEAARSLGAAIMHALACDGKLDNGE